jgi:hypothetical protein
MSQILKPQVREQLNQSMSVNDIVELFKDEEGIGVDVYAMAAAIQELANFRNDVERNLKLIGHK